MVYAGTAPATFGKPGKAAAISMLMARNFKRISYISLPGLSLHQDCP
jgi:hypothetical protein